MQPLFFDLDDTILVYHGVSEQAWTEACDIYIDHFSNLSSSQLLNVILAASSWFWSDEKRFKKMMHNLVEALRQVVSKAFEMLKAEGIAVPNQEVANTIADYFTHRREELIYPFPGALETLRELQQRGTPLTMITNSNAEVQQRKIDRFHLDKYFDNIIISGAFGYDKPDSRIFQHALDFYKIDGDNTSLATMIGDSLTSDIFGASQLGIQTIWNDWRKSGLPQNAPAKPDRIIHSIQEIL